jgi:hypothetical protein
LTGIKAGRLEFLGQVIIKEDGRIAKKILNAKPKGRRRFGGPKMRSLDDVETDIKTLNILKWRLKIRNGRRMVNKLNGAVKSERNIMPLARMVVDGV